MTGAGSATARAAMPAATILTRIRRRLAGVFRAAGPAVPSADEGWVARRIAMTLRCRDTDPLPKVPQAGAVIERDGRRVQVMHEGTLVEAGGYHGDWMERVIRGLRGHHEPQEELVFHHLVAHCRPGTTIVEIGAFWAYYTNWYLGAVPGSNAVCLEPDANSMACGERNLALNGRSATWVNAFAGRDHAAAVTMRRESDGAVVTVPCHSLDSLLDLVGRRPIEMLHVDCQGAELPLLESLGRTVREGLLRFVVISTHHAAISGSPTTHQDCLRLLEGLGATILCEHSVGESFSGDGLIAASFHAADTRIVLPPISRNDPRESLFGTGGGRRVALADVEGGQMLVFEDDAVIGRTLREQGRFEEDALVDVVRFLRHRHGFRPRLLVDVGANIGTHLLRGLRDGLFPKGVGVEMDADNFRLLVGNVHLAACQDRTRLFHVAVSDAVGSVAMELAADNFGDHRVQAAHPVGPPAFDEPHRDTRPVAATTLDALEAACGMEFDEGTLLWIDTQGHEGHVLAGAGEILGRAGRPAVVLEFWPYGLERCGGRDRLFRFLRRCGAIYDLGSAGWQDRPPLADAELASLYDGILAKDGRERLAFTDLLCMP